tara:strand:- start:80072 stop:80320 length:249 start_codon:yes stop_codon:yes gene_type:complete
MSIAKKIYVLKDFLSLKMGLALQNQLFEKAIEENNKKIWVSILNSNDRAKICYAKNGFKKIGIHDFQIGNENFEFTAMAKLL